jgi:hypothetical protein
MRRLTALALLAAFGAAATAHAQSTTVQTERPTAACPPGVGNDPPTVGSGPNTNLSDKLADSKGVICPPPSADQEMSVAPPATGSNMPVIPPKGSPGTDQSVQPK